MLRLKLWRRGESNPCFDDIRLRASADVLREGTHEEVERRGLFWMAADVISFVITSRLWPASGNDQIRNILPRVLGIKLDGSVESRPKKLTERRRKDSRMNIRKGFRDKAEFEAGTSGFGSTA
jgi:hypothetical protein